MIDYYTKFKPTIWNNTALDNMQFILFDVNKHLSHFDEVSPHFLQYVKLETTSE